MEREEKFGPSQETLAKIYTNVIPPDTEKEARQMLGKYYPLANGQQHGFGHFVDHVEIPARSSARSKNQ